MTYRRFPPAHPDLATFSFPSGSRAYSFSACLGSTTTWDLSSETRVRAALTPILVTPILGGWDGGGALDCGLLPISMYALGFFESVAYHDFEGPSLELVGGTGDGRVIGCAAIFCL